MSVPSTSELQSSASEFSSLTVQCYGHIDLKYPQNRLRGKRGFDTAEGDNEDVTPTKRAASSGIEDLSCMETTVFDRVSDSECTTDVEAQSQLLLSTSRFPKTDEDEICSLIREGMHLEQLLPVCPHYMDRHGAAGRSQQHLEPSMRCVTASWLVEVACEFQLQQGTLFLAVDLLDRFLSRAKAVPRSNLQMTAVACIMIAAKVEQETHPSAHDFTNIADYCFQVHELIKMESLVLQTLDFRVMKPNAYTMLCLLRQALEVGKRDAALAMYLAELSLLEYRMLQYKPSTIAAAAMLIVQARDGDQESVVGLCLMTGLHPSQLQPCAELILGLQEQAHKAVELYDPLTAVQGKYKDKLWQCASCEPPLDRAALVFAVASASRNAAVQSLQKPTWTL